MIGDGAPMADAAPRDGPRWRRALQSGLPETAAGSPRTAHGATGSDAPACAAVRHAVVVVVVVVGGVESDARGRGIVPDDAADKDSIS